MTTRVQNNKIRASIDIGTNSVLLLVAAVSENGLNVLNEKQEIPRLGKGVDQDRNLHPDSRKRVIEVLKRYRDFLLNNYPETVQDTVITATSAVRDSANRDEFLDQIKGETGWNVKLLTGDDEAKTTYAGAVTVLENRKGEFTVIDIGGGSTEVAIGSGDTYKNGISMDMGSVRFSERYLKHNPPLKHELKAARDAVSDLLEKNLLDLEGSSLIGVAGTVTSIAAILLDLETYDAQRVNDFHLKREKISNFIKEFSEIGSEEIEKKYGRYLKGRGDVITGGLLILDEFMKCYNYSELTVSTGGIRHGILL